VNTISDIETIARRYRVKEPAGGALGVFHAARKLDRIIARNADRIDYHRYRVAKAEGTFALQCRADLARLLGQQAQARADLAELETLARSYDGWFRHFREGAKQSGDVADETPSLDTAMDQITAYIQQGKTIHAIRLYRQAAGVGLLDAKAAVERIVADMTAGA
jgi:hypothetical protein